jgi:hypothetical protein
MDFDEELDFGKRAVLWAVVTQERGSILFYFCVTRICRFCLATGEKSFHRVEGHSRQRFDPEDAEL